MNSIAWNSRTRPSVPIRGPDTSTAGAGAHMEVEHAAEPIASPSVTIAASGSIVVAYPDGTTASIVVPPDLAVRLIGHEAEVAHLLVEDPGLLDDPSELAELVEALNPAQSGAEEIADPQKTDDGIVAREAAAGPSSGSQLQTPFDAGGPGRAVGHLPPLRDDGVPTC